MDELYTTNSLLEKLIDINLKISEKFDKLLDDKFNNIKKEILKEDKNVRKNLKKFDINNI